MLLLVVLNDNPKSSFQQNKAIKVETKKLKPGWKLVKLNLFCRICCKIWLKQEKEQK